MLLNSKQHSFLDFILEVARMPWRLDPAGRQWRTQELSERLPRLQSVRPTTTPWTFGCGSTSVTSSWSSQTLTTGSLAGRVVAVWWTREMEVLGAAWSITWPEGVVTSFPTGFKQLHVTIMAFTKLDPIFTARSPALASRHIIILRTLLQVRPSSDACFSF